jgi:hypothetical protein
VRRFNTVVAIEEDAIELQGVNIVSEKSTIVQKKLIEKSST